MNDRTQLIEDVLTAHWRSNHFELTTWERRAWIEEIANTPELAMGKTLGFLPAAVLPDGRVHIEFCPAVIDETTEHLDDKEFAEFMLVIRMMTAHSAINVDVPLADRAVIVDDKIAETALTYDLLTQVRVRALNRATA